MSEAPADKAQTITRLKLLALIMCFAGPLLLATIWFALTDPNEGVITRNNGELIEPATPLTAFQLQATDGEIVDLDGMRGHWTLIYFGGSDCGEDCMRNIYHMRQVRTSLHRQMHRLHRVFVTPAPEAFEQSLRDEYPEMVWASGSAEDISALRAQFDTAQAKMPAMPDAVYLIDPLGNLMMRFAPDLDPGLMLKDVKHLLKVSRVG